MDSTIKAIIKNTLLLMAVMFVLLDAADCAEHNYYSIHLFSFKNLEDANKHVNSLRNKGETVFWENVNIQGVGKYYHVYMGRYKNWDDAIKFRSKIKETGAGSPLGIQYFSETFVPDKKPVSSKFIAAKKTATDQMFSRIPKKDRFVDNGDGTITDRKTNLMWIKNGWRVDFASAATWQDAVKKSKSINVGGYDNWRLPTIEEWRSLIDTNNQNFALTKPNPFVNIISHMPYWSQTEVVDGNNHASNKQPLESYTVMLCTGELQHQNKTGRAFIMPIRSIDLPGNFANNTAR